MFDFNRFLTPFRVYSGAKYLATKAFYFAVVELLEDGFDVQISGFGTEDQIHGDNEFGFYSDVRKTDNSSLFESC